MAGVEKIFKTKIETAILCVETVDEENVIKSILFLLRLTTDNSQE